VAREDVSYGEALRRAMLDLMQTEALPGAFHPAVWAPFAVVGAG
jgi:CHAT domain-containing protein